MGHFYVWKFQARHRLLAILILAFICATFIYTKSPITLPTFTQDKPVAITKGNDKEKKIALTFNISWGDTKVYDILQVLKEHKLRATFFVSGEWAERHPHILEEITKEKHEIGMLGYRYQSYIEQDIEAVKKDIQEAIQVFNKLGFDHMTYIRPPSGHFNKEVIETIEQIGLEPVHWSVHPNDSENPGTDTITKQLVQDVSNGDIILLHASDAAKQTAEALKTVIPTLHKKKLQFVTLSELIHEVSLEEELIE